MTQETAQAIVRDCGAERAYLSSEQIRHIAAGLRRWFNREPTEIAQDEVVTVPFLLRQLEDVACDLEAYRGGAPFEADVCRWSAQTIRALVRERDGLLALVPKDSAREAR